MSNGSELSEENKPLSLLKGIGPQREKAFSSAGIKSIQDLLFYFPRKYLDRSNIIDTSKAFEYVNNGYDGEITIIGRISNIDARHFRGKDVLKVSLKDDKGFFEAVWFNGVKYLKDAFNVGEVLAISGEPKLSKYGLLQIAHPDIDKITTDETKSFFNTGKIIPFYSLPASLRAKNLGDTSIRKIIYNCLNDFLNEIKDTLPENLLEKNTLPTLSDAVKKIHSPVNHSEIEFGYKRLKYEEIFYLELIAALRYRLRRFRENRKPYLINPHAIKPFLDSLPFDLTEAQLSALTEIRRDLQSSYPMNRLLQGDVGSGKTVTALVAMLIVINNGYQVLLMAPTEVLAQQHYKSISKMLSSYSENKKGTQIKCALVTGSIKGKERTKVLEAIKNNETNIVIGTHALFEEGVEPSNAGLFVIDEQHRFGVDQRLKLTSKGKIPDILVMSATPIPRTLAMTVYGDLDVSVIKTMPKSRLPVQTFVMGESETEKVYNFACKKIEEGNQVFIIYPLVEESEKLDLKAAESEYEVLRTTAFAPYRVGLLHGKMKWHEKEDIMHQFRLGELDVLVSTTVVEVGIDVPDANVMIIHNSFRFGLSQLHQLRGRVGRGSKQGYCFLVTSDFMMPAVNKFLKMNDFLSKKEKETRRAAMRLAAMKSTNDGFKISEIDLEIRGPGDVFGLMQSGYPDLKYANLVADAELIQIAKEDAFAIIENDPDLKQVANQPIKETLTAKYSKHLKYFNIG